MLSIKTRQQYLKYLGFYKGAIDGICGDLTKKAIKALQDKYFTRKSDKDGIYGKNTDILLVNAYRVKKYTKNFTLYEFRCECIGSCTGYPDYLHVSLLKNLQTMRDYYGTIRITCGLRCQRYNNSLKGSAPNSYHLYGKALDLYNTKFSANYTTRKNAIEKWLTLPSSEMGYENGYMHHKGRSATGYNAPNMGNAIHLQVN